jgi:uncharacterized membrane protein YeiB
MLFARREFLKRRRRRKNTLIAYSGVVIGVIVEIMVSGVMSEASLFDLDRHSVYAFSFYVSMPAFILISSSLCILFIQWFNDLSVKFKRNKLIKRLVLMGSMKHTLYIGHLLTGIMLSWMFNEEKLFSHRPILGGLIIGFYLVCMIFAGYWRKQYDHGPVEWLLHRMAGTDDKG